MPRSRHIAHHLVAVAFYYSGALAIYRWLRRRVGSPSEVAVLGLHRILTERQAAVTCSESAMVVMVTTFQKLLHLLSKQFHVISLRDFLNGNIPHGPKPNCLITFDDAWLDTFENAYPALREAGLPATVFVPTGLIGTGNFFWVERLAILWRGCGENHEALCRAICEELGQAPVATLDELIAVLKRGPSSQRESLLRSLTLRFSHGGKPDVVDTFMSWEQLLAMAPVFEVASHTVSHLLLAIEEERIAKGELLESRRILQDRIGSPVIALAYPSGSFNERVRELTADAGYQWAFTVRSGTYRAGDDPLTVPRFLLQEGNITSPWGSFSPAMFHFRLTGWR